MKVIDRKLHVDLALFRRWFWGSDAERGAHIVGASQLSIPEVGSNGNGTVTYTYDSANVGVCNITGKERLRFWWTDSVVRPISRK